MWEIIQLPLPTSFLLNCVSSPHWQGLVLFVLFCFPHLYHIFPVIIKVICAYCRTFGKYKGKKKRKWKNAYYSYFQRLKILTLWCIPYFNCLSFYKVSHYSLQQSWFSGLLLSAPKFLSGNQYIFLGCTELRSWSIENAWEKPELTFSFQLQTYYSKKLNGFFTAFPRRFCSHDLIVVWFFPLIMRVQLLMPLSKLVLFIFILHLDKMPLPVLLCGTRAIHSLIPQILSPLGILSLPLISAPTLVISYVSFGQPRRQGII